MDRSAFLIVTKQLAADNRISATAKLLLAQLADHRNKRTGQCNPRRNKLAEEMGVSIDKVDRAAKELQRTGYLTWKRGRHSAFYEIPVPQGCGSHSAQVRNWGSRSLYEPSSSEQEIKLKSFDDEEPKTPEAWFRQRLVDRHGSTFAVNDCIRNVRRQLEKCSGLTFEEFVAYDEARTTGNDFTNAAGYYVHLAKQLVLAARQRAAEAIAPLRPAATPEYQRDGHGRCVECGGSGMLADGRFCEKCPLGRDLEGLQRRSATREQRAAQKGAAA